jgi:hypothetical protein
MVDMMSDPHMNLFRVAFASVGSEYRVGHTDCATLTRRCLTSMLGRDPWDGYVPRWNNGRTALKAAHSVDGPVTALTDTGASEVMRGGVKAGDVAVGPDGDTDRVPQLSILLSEGHALVSRPDVGVCVVGVADLLEGTRFFRYEGIADV